MASLCHPWFTTTNLSYRFPIFETSATALCGTSGNNTYTYIYIYIYYIIWWSLSAGLRSSERVRMRIRSTTMIFWQMFEPGKYDPALVWCSLACCSNSVPNRSFQTDVSSNVPPAKTQQLKICGLSLSLNKNWPWMNQATNLGLAPLSGYCCWWTPVAGCSVQAHTLFAKCVILCVPGNKRLLEKSATQQAIAFYQCFK